MGDRPDGFETIERMRSEAGSVPAVAEFLRAIDRWIEDDTDAPLQQYLRFPVTPARRRRYLRDRWLARAAAEVEAPGTWAGALALAAEMERFVSQGLWARWHDAGGPPEGASRLRSALYHALFLNDGRCLSADQLQRITSHVFPKQCDSTSPTIHASESFEDTDA